ncbi:MAG: type IV pili twitching motility protein PilT, partial [Gemmatimonadales bacterium]
MGSTAEADAPASASTFDYKAILHQMVQKGASDLHIKVGRPPTLRINGELIPMELPAIRLEDVRHIAEQSMTARHMKEFAAVKE